MGKQALWLRVVHRVERAVGGPVEKAVSSTPYYDTVATARRATRLLKGAAEDVSRRGLHLFNLPAGTDIRRVREQLARMDRRLVQIAKEIDELEAAARESRRSAGTDKARSPST